MKKLLLTVLLASTLLLAGCTKEEPRYTIEEDTTDYTKVAYVNYLSEDNPVITIKVVDMGEIKIELFPSQAPNTVNNIIAYIQRGDYEFNEFHRVVTDFVIQGGALDNPSCTILGEMNNNNDFTGDNKLKHYRGIISMARYGGQYNSASSQFFIVHEDSLFLDDEYAAFGGVVAGMNIVDFIANMENGSTQMPTESIVIENITVELNGYEYTEPVCE